MIYCSDMQPKQFEITKYTLKAAVNKIHIWKSPGSDLLIVYWFKKFTFYIELLVNLHQNTFEGSTTLPDWLTLAKTILLPKNEHTHAAKNYQTIACLNLTYKLYTSCLNNFLEHHCRTNSIITTEQAGGEGNYKTITNQQKHPKRSKNPKKNI